MYHFLSGYTSKVSGTEQGIDAPEATFSACFGQPFLVLHPIRYAKMLAQRMEQHNANAWLINTGWTGQSYLHGRRCPLRYTRAILDAIHDGSLLNEEYEILPVFQLRIPKGCRGVPTELLNPARAWVGSLMEFERETLQLAELFRKNFMKYHDRDQTTDDLLV